jgi:hypothetical protein
MAMEPDVYKKFGPNVMKSHYGPNANYTVDDYTDVAQLVGKNYTEYGICFSDEIIEDVVKYILKGLLRVQILRASGYANVSSIKVLPLKDVLADNFESSEENWTELSNADDVDKFSLGDIEEFYERVSDNA